MKNKSFFKEILLFSVVGLFINLFCVILFFVSVHASSVSSGIVPYVVPSWRNANSFCSAASLNIAIDHYTDIMNNSNFSNYSYLVFSNDGLENSRYLQLYFLTNPSINYSISSSFDYTSNMVTVTGNDVSIMCIYIDSYTGEYYGTVQNIGWEAFLLGNSATVSNSLGNFTARYPFYLGGTNEIKSTNDVVIFTNTVNYTPPEFTGHAVPPDSFEEPIFSTGHAKPSQVPQLTINNYTWTTPPTPDFSTLEDTAVSIYNYLSWLGSNLLGAFGNLINNIGTVAEYLGKTLQYYLGLILSAIINGITNFYNNLVALIEPFLNYYTEPIDTQAVQDTVEDTSIYGLITVGWNFHNTYKDFFDSITQVNTLTFTIPYTIWTQSGYIVVDFSWYDDIRDLILPWIVGFLYAGFGLYIFRSIPSIIHGLSGVMQKGA